ncbi:MAG: FYDLN acid domain-containing protein [Rhodospirillales bacterium]
MVAKDLGKKLSCQSCDAKFYDLMRTKPVCPKCDTAYVPAKPRGRRAAASLVPPVKNEPPKLIDDTEENDDLETDEDEDEDSSLMEDTSDIGNDEDDVAEVVVNISSSVDDKET